MHTESNLQQLLDVQYQLVNAGVQKSIHPAPLIILFPPVAAGDQSPSEVEQECIQLAKELYSKYVHAVQEIKPLFIPFFCECELVAQLHNKLEGLRTEGFFQRHRSTHALFCDDFWSFVSVSELHVGPSKVCILELHLWHSM